MRVGLKLAFAIGLIGLGVQSAAMAAPDPKGDGEPSAMACRPSDTATGSRVRRPQVCLTNAQWGALHAKKLTISTDGKRVVGASRSGYAASPYFSEPSPNPPPAQDAVPTFSPVNNR